MPLASACTHNSCYICAARGNDDSHCVRIVHAFTLACAQVHDKGRHGKGDLQRASAAPILLFGMQRLGRPLFRGIGYPPCRPSAGGLCKRGTTGGPLASAATKRLWERVTGPAAPTAAAAGTAGLGITKRLPTGIAKGLLGDGAGKASCVGGKKGRNKVAAGIAHRFG